MKHMTAAVHAPVAPTSLAATGLGNVLCRDIMLKTMFRRNLNLSTDIAEALCVLPPVANELIEMCREQNLIETLGLRGDTSTELRYQLTDSGRARAIDALSQSEYYGALPVTLEAFREQSQRQSITDVTITKERIECVVPKKGWITQIIDTRAPATPQIAALSEKVKA